MGGGFEKAFSASHSETTHLKHSTPDVVYGHLLKQLRWLGLSFRNVTNFLSAVEMFTMSRIDLR